MTKLETIKLEIDNRGVAKLILNRPEKHNALSAKMIQELTDIADDIANNKEIRVVVLAGEGSTFCAGGDINWMKEQLNATRDQRISESKKLALMLKALNELPKPMIGMINGSAFGGGVGIMCVCDFAVTVESAKFGLTETKLGLIPATIGPYVIAKIGEGKTRRIFLSSRIFNADEAFELGICSKIVSNDEIKQVVEEEVQSYLKVSSNAVTQAKSLARSLGKKIDAEVIENTIIQLADIWDTDDAREGITAFLERRSPPWVQKN